MLRYLRPRGAPTCTFPLIITVQFTPYAPKPRRVLNIERDISVTNDISGWQFRATGNPQPFEKSDRYLTEKKPEQFTSEMLEEYCGALGIDLFDESFYGGRGALIRSRFWFFPRPKGTSVREAQIGLGINID